MVVMPQRTGAATWLVMEPKQESAPIAHSLRSRKPGEEGEHKTSWFNGQENSVGKSNLVLLIKFGVGFCPQSVETG